MWLISQTSAEKPPKNDGVRKANSLNIFLNVFRQFRMFHNRRNALQTVCQLPSGVSQALMMMDTMQSRICRFP